MAANTNGSKFIVPRETWRGSRTFHYCQHCKDVVGVKKQDQPLCPVCATADLPDIFSIIDGKLLTMTQFVENVRVKEGPYGRYRGYQDDPRPYRMVAADQALSLNHQMRWCGYTPPWSPEQLESWIDTILLDVNPDSGLIEDVFEIAEKGRTEEVLFSMYNLSRGLEIVFRRAGFPGKYRLPEDKREEVDVLSDEDTAIAFLNDRKNPAEFLNKFTWATSPYSKGAQVVWALRNHEAVLQANGRADDGITEMVHEWLDRKQNPATGYWGGEAASMNDAACGAFKLFVAYRERGWPINNLERIVDTTLSIATAQGDFGDDGFGCTVFDPLLLLKVALRECPHYRTEDVYAATARCFLNFLNHWSDREHFFTPQPMPDGRAELVGINGLATPMYMAEILLGAKILPDHL